jgi:hypothetical protein
MIKDNSVDGITMQNHHFKTDELLHERIPDASLDPVLWVFIVFLVGMYTDVPASSHSISYRGENAGLAGC